MRSLMAALVALLLAGCLASNSPPTPSSTTTTPTTTTTTTAPPPQGGPATGSLVRPAHEEATNASVTLTADESASGFFAGPDGSVTFSFIVRNDGAPLRYQSLCVPTIRVQVIAPDGKPVVIERPQAHCMAIAYADLGTGEHANATLRWNGTTYDGDQASTVPPGRYEVTGTFRFERDGEASSVSVTIPVNVLDPSERGVA